MTLSLYAISVSLVCRPLDGIQVHAVLVHFPEGRKLPELRHLALDEVGSIVDLLLGRETPERDADRAVRELVGPAERPQHVRRLSEADVQAEPEDTARSFTAMISDSPSTKLKLTFRL